MYPSALSTRISQSKIAVDCFGTYYKDLDYLVQILSFEHFYIKSTVLCLPLCLIFLYFSLVSYNIFCAFPTKRCAWIIPCMPFPCSQIFKTFPTLVTYTAYLIWHTVSCWIPVHYKIEYHGFCVVYWDRNYHTKRFRYQMFLLHSVFGLQQVNQHIFMSEQKIWKWHNL